MLLERKIIEFTLSEKGYSPKNGETPESRIMCGYAATWDEDLSGDIIHKGAFLKAIKSRFTDSTRIRGYGRIRFMYQHQEVIGVIREIREDEKGLYIEAYFSKTHRGNEILTLVHDKALDQMSIGFVVDPDGFYYDPQGRRHIISMDIQECSVVIFPMNEDTDIMEVRSRNFPNQEQFEMGTKASPEDKNMEAKLLDFEIKELNYRTEQVKLELKKGKKLSKDTTAKLLHVMKGLHEVLCTSFAGVNETHSALASNDQDDAMAAATESATSQPQQNKEVKCGECMSNPCICNMGDKGMNSDSAGALRTVMSTDLLGGKKDSSSNVVGQNPIAMKNPSNPQTLPNQGDKEDYGFRSDVENLSANSEVSPNAEGTFKSSEKAPGSNQATLPDEADTDLDDISLQSYLQGISNYFKF